ncbi:MAG: hypothetical protein JO020_21890 [Chloroflexi bacterium]|nr:hypothetical protein [Chloroflexota bacterium]
MGIAVGGGVAPNGLGVAELCDCCRRTLVLTVLVVVVRAVVVAVALVLARGGTGACRSPGLRRWVTTDLVAGTERGHSDASGRGSGRSTGAMLAPSRSRSRCTAG